MKQVWIVGASPLNMHTVRDALHNHCIPNANTATQQHSERENTHTVYTHICSIHIYWVTQWGAKIYMHSFSMNWAQLLVEHGRICPVPSEYPGAKFCSRLRLLHRVINNNISDPWWSTCICVYICSRLHDVLCVSVCVWPCLVCVCVFVCVCVCGSISPLSARCCGLHVCVAAVSLFISLFLTPLSLSLCMCRGLHFLCLLFQMDLPPYQAANEAVLFILRLFEWRGQPFNPAQHPTWPPCIFRPHLISCWINTRVWTPLEGRAARHRNGSNRRGRRIVFNNNRRGRAAWQESNSGSTTAFLDKHTFSESNISCLLEVVGACHHFLGVFTVNSSHCQDDWHLPAVHFTSRSLQWE